MKNIFFRASSLILCLCTLFPPLQAKSAKAPETVAAFSECLDGTMMPYDFSQTETEVPWDDSYTPVFINYVARHGARFLSSAKKTENLRRRLERARSTGRLTPAGLDFLHLVEKVDSVTDGRWGALSPLGEEEEVRLGQEMAATAPSLLNNGVVMAHATYVPRVVDSMHDFCKSLASRCPSLHIEESDGKQYNSLLRYFTTNGQYVEYLENGPWRFALATYCHDILPVEPAAKMFYDVLDSHVLQKITLDAYGVLQSLPAAGLTADPAEWFTPEEFRSCWVATNLKHYYQRSSSTFSPIASEAARPLLNALTENARKAFAGISDTKAELYFGHAETLLPLFSLMQLPGCYAPKCKPEQVASQWHDYDITPLGANLMMVCLRDSKGQPVVAMRLNGKWLDINGSRLIPWKKLDLQWNKTRF